jgi:hypothetical protein
LLTSLDVRPDGWRRCALKFLEAQCWTDELKQLVHAPPTGENSLTIPRPAPVKVLETEYSTSTRRGVSWAAIAAGLLIAFTLGIVARNGGPSIDTPVVVDNQAVNPEASIAQVVPPTGPDAAKVDDALTLFVRDETGQTRPLRVPLVDARTLDRELGLQFRTGLPEELRTRLKNGGFDVQSKRSYAPLWLEDGRPMFVPVEDTKIVPVRQNVY